MPSAFLQDAEASPSQKSSFKTVIARTYDVAMNAKRFFSGPDNIDIYKPVHLNDNLIASYVRAEEALRDYKANRPGSSLGATFNKAAEILHTETRNGLSQIKNSRDALYGSDECKNAAAKKYHQLSTDFNVQANTYDEYVSRLKVVCEAAKVAPVVGRCLNHFLNEADQYRWKEIEPSGLEGFTQVFTGPRRP